jgi:hypothetical protein
MDIVSRMLGRNASPKVGETVDDVTRAYVEGVQGCGTRRTLTGSN